MISQTMIENERLLRDEMKNLLSQCPPEQQDVFRRMYNHEGKFENHSDGVESSRLDWAFYQIENGLKSYKEKQSKLSLATEAKPGEK